jgi:hypothetical protein
MIAKPLETWEDLENAAQELFNCSIFDILQTYPLMGCDDDG